MNLQRPVGWVLRHWMTLAIASWIASGALYLTLPPSPDQFQHAYMGWRLLEGDAPYRDFIDMNWPGVMALHALAAWIFGINLWSWRAFDFALFAASALFLGDLIRLAAGRDAGKLSLVLSPLIYAGTPYWVAGQHDMSAAQFLVAVLWFHVRGYERRAWWYQIGTGLCIGAAMLSKPTVGVIGLLLPLQALWIRIPVPRIIAHTSVAGAAAVAALLAALGAVLLRGASLNDVIEAIYMYNAATQYVGDQSIAELMLRLLQFHYQGIPAVTFGSIPAIYWIFDRTNRSMAATSLFLLWLTGVLSYFAQWRGLPYHLAPCLIALSGGLAISTALVAAGRINAGHTAWKQSTVAGMVAVSLLWTGLKLAGSYRSLAPAFLEGDSKPHLERFSAGDDVNFAEVVAFVRRLDALPASECVLLVGDTSSINYLSKRRMPTRFYYYHVLRHLDPPTPMEDRWAGLWDADLRVADCRYALISRSVGTHWLREPGSVAASLRQFLGRYRESGTIGHDGGIVVYERK